MNFLNQRWTLVLIPGIFLMQVKARLQKANLHFEHGKY